MGPEVLSSSSSTHFFALGLYPVNLDEVALEVLVFGLKMAYNNRKGYWGYLAICELAIKGREHYFIDQWWSSGITFWPEEFGERSWE